MFMALVAVLKMIFLFLVPGLIIFRVGYTLTEICRILVEEFRKSQDNKNKVKGDDE